MTKRKNQQQLQISTFIKQPASLKLLILAGTNIKISQLSIVTKCTGLIKLDLSSNYLTQLPIKFSIFTQMKILYLHDNQLTNVDIKNTQLQYISLFKNPIQLTSYRKNLIVNNPSLIGIDYNVITAKQRYDGEGVKLPIYSEIKWPIVEISTNLEHQDDYLNLLKAEIFVIGNVQKRTLKIQTIQKIFQGIIQPLRYQIKKHEGPSKMIILPSVFKAIQKWKQFTLLKRKLRAILSKKNKQNLLYTQLQINRQNRSQGVNKVMQVFLPMVRMKMKIRDVIQRNLRSFRTFIPAEKQLQSNYLGFQINRDYIKNPAKLYFRNSQLDILSKVCLYTKKLFFKQKDYDLCDEFNNLFKQTNKKYYIFRKKNYLENQTSWIMNSIHQTSGYVLSQCGVDRQRFLYTKQGHKSIGIKAIKRFKKDKNLQNKLAINERKFQYLFSKYDKLIQYEVKNWKILKNIIRIIRYINAGNSQSIISTETAYFQTQVIFEDKNQKVNKNKTKFHIGLQFFTQRAIAANIIQKSWRKYITKKKSFRIIQTIKKQRAQNLISKWIRNLIFLHRMTSVKTRSYYSSAFKDKQVYMHLQVYMSMPEPTNYLRFQKKLENKEAFYNILHKNTQVQIVQTNRRWIKIQYQTAKQAANAQNNFLKGTYRYSNGFYLRLFNQNQINDTKMLAAYEKNILNLFKIIITPLTLSEQTKNTKTTLWIDNTQPYFIWSQINALQNFAKFEKHEKHNTNVNIFIYNKHKRPLKVSCELYWTNQNSLYQNRKYKPPVKGKNIHSIPNSPVKQNGKFNFLKDSEGDLSIFDLQVDLKNEKRKGKAKYLIDLQSKIDKSQEKDHRRSSIGTKNNTSLSKSIRSRIVSDHKFEHISETLNIRKK